MLYSLLRNWDDLGVFGVLCVLFSYAVILLVMLPVHELAHAYAAYRLGDSTAKWQGRLTMNPFKHLDVLGTVMILTVGVGYAKPVPVNPYNFRKPKQDMALTALAGPVSNLLMAALSVGLYRLFTVLFGGGLMVVGNMIYYSNVIDLVFYVIFIKTMASVNIGLAVFNLLPIPPLDGSRIWALVLPDRWVYRMEQYAQYITIGIMLLLFTGVLDVPLDFLRGAVGWVLCRLFGLPNLF